MTPPAGPTRVVSLLPAATEIVAALGGMEQLVGVTHECDHPAMVAALPRVTSSSIDSAALPGTIDAQVRTITGAGQPLYSLNEELIRALRPELILTQALCDVCAVMETDVRALAARLAAAPQVLTLSASSLEGVFGDIRDVAAALDLSSEADELIAGLRARMRTVHATLKAAAAPRPRVAVIEWSDPVFAGGHWVPEQVKRAGGVDVLGVAGEHSRVVTIDEVAAARPDVVVVAPCGYSLDRSADEAEALLSTDAWRFLRACDVWAIDANALTSRPGPRLVDGVEVLARILNPKVFSPLGADHARLVHGARRVARRGAP